MLRETVESTASALGSHASATSQRNAGNGHRNRDRGNLLS